MSILNIFTGLWSRIRLFVIIGGAVACVMAVWVVRGVIDEKRLESALESQRKELLKQCQEDKDLTNEVSTDYQKKIAALNRAIDNLKLHPAQCVTVTSAAGGHNAAAGGRVNDRPHEVTDYQLIDYAAIAERYRLQLIGCQNFIKKVWEKRSPAN